MTGLVFLERLQLSGAQWASLFAAMGLYLSRVERWRAVLLSQGAMFAAFFGAAVSIDVKMLFHEVQFLQRFDWLCFLSEFAHRNYVFLQPPCYTFWVSRLPDLRVHQVVMLPWALLCGGLLLALFGERARALLACPVWLLMSVQPSNDLVLFGLVLAALRCHQLGSRAAGAIVFGLCYPIKPLAVLVLPSMAWRLRGWTLISLAMWGGYVLWSLQYYFGVRQWKFLLHQLCVQ